MKNLELGNLEYKIVEEFLADLKKNLKKVMKVAELRKRRDDDKKICTRVQEDS